VTILPQIPHSLILDAPAALRKFRQVALVPISLKLVQVFDSTYLCFDNIVFTTYIFWGCHYHWWNWSQFVWFVIFGPTCSIIFHNLLLVTSVTLACIYCLIVSFGFVFFYLFFGINHYHFFIPSIFLYH